jgi:hypothetical protein
MGKTPKKKRVQYDTQQVTIKRILPLNLANVKVITYQFNKHFISEKYGRDFVNKFVKQSHI